ncbi:hypothetical protein BJ508DRAFT_325450 [Ascobolus immersus RN42]|uniref:Uncharacterized protein n=1 Tax=Ascobolus immersus RN42 TaxID=1160509 RepID=A0A3N4IE10_ASCIM|nr:hypothetical protein BJ508DRAFT_325450 [Ascobolus immersus RN42]
MSRQQGTADEEACRNAITNKDHDQLPPEGHSELVLAATRMHECRESEPADECLGIMRHFLQNSTKLEGYDFNSWYEVEKLLAIQKIYDWLKEDDRHVKPEYQLNEDRVHVFKEVVGLLVNGCNIAPFVQHSANHLQNLAYMGAPDRRRSWQLHKATLIFLQTLLKRSVELQDVDLDDIETKAGHGKTVPTVKRFGVAQAEMKL